MMMGFVSVQHRWVGKHATEIKSVFLQGRVKLDGYIGKPVNHLHQNKKLTGFALHTVNCTFHPYGDLSLYDVEEIFQEKFGDMSMFDGFMDFNLGLWTNNLDSYVKYVNVILYSCAYNLLQEISR